ncbi:MAG: Na+/H+ antiporter subunit E [Xanthomonadales bacterium]
MDASPDKRRDVAERSMAIGRMAVLAVLLAATWVLWSGMFKPLLLGLGAVSCLLVLYLARRMHLFEHDVISVRFTGRLLRFWGWLGREIVRSSLEVTRVVLSPGLPISPTVAEFDSDCEHPVDRTILGNSITLTPGTLTLRIDGQHFIVHALTEAGAQDIVDGEMERRVHALRSD